VLNLSKLSDEKTLELLLTALYAPVIYATGRCSGPGGAASLGNQLAQAVLKEVKL
jgi:hypothetical protein